LEEEVKERSRGCGAVEIDRKRESWRDIERSRGCRSREKWKIN
jgi:hypothetical protein